MNYSPKYFKENLPEWKRKKDPVVSKLFYRPVSFLTASICANLNISANAVSYFSAIIGVIASILFLFNNNLLAILGGVLVNIWLILDCTDGNIARSVKSQPMGGFADSVSSYTIVALIFNTMGYYVFHQGGVIFKEGTALILLLGALASTFDTLARLIFQKFQNSSDEYFRNKDMKANNEFEESKINKIRVRIDSEIGLGGILPLAILMGAIFNFLDIIILIWFLYYGGLCILSSLYNILKAIKITKSEDK